MRVKGPKSINVLCEHCRSISIIFIPIHEWSDRVLVSKGYRPAFIGWYCPQCATPEARKLRKVVGT